MHQLQHAGALPSAQVHRHETRVILGIRQGLHMALRQVHDVQIVAHARAVGRVVIVSEHAQERLPAHRHLGDEGKQVVGQVAGAFTDQPAGVRADGIEIAQRDRTESRRRRADIAQHFLHHQLGAAVGTVADELNTSRATPISRIACSKASDPATWLS
ncbi:hypothetical protein G6F65_019463 [Rhizopus arrhizus]|nr:hypothetical protein G6F65_019463 [Rhizopus arrhizus]